MADMNKIASILGFEDNDDGTAVEQAQEAITEAAKKTGSVKKRADLLGIDYDAIMQVALIPIAYTKGTDFKPARRRDLDKIVHVDAW